MVLVSMPQINVGFMDRIKTDLTSVYISELTSFFRESRKILGFRVWMEI